MSKIIMDYFCFDTETKKLTQIDYLATKDSFPSVFNQEINGKKVTIKKSSKLGVVSIAIKGGLLKPDTVIAEVKDDCIMSLNLPKAVYIPDTFLAFDKTIKRISMPKVRNIGYEFMKSNKVLSELYAPSSEKIGMMFLPHNMEIKKLSLPKARRLDDFFLSDNEELSELVARNVEVLGAFALHGNRNLKTLSMPKLQRIGFFCLGNNPYLNAKIEQKRTELATLRGQSMQKTR